MNSCGEIPLFTEKTWQQLEFSEKIIGFSCLSLKLSLTLPHKGKMLWCSYFRPFIKSTSFSRTGSFIKKIYFVSTPWKIIITLGNSVGGPILVIQMHLVGNDYFYTKMSFFDNFVEKIDSGWSSQKKYLVFPTYP